MLKDQNQRLEDCETARKTVKQTEKEEKEVEKEEWDTEDRGERETEASKARGQRGNTLFGDAPLCGAHPDSHPQNSHLKQAVSSSFFR